MQYRFPLLSVQTSVAFHSFSIQISLTFNADFLYFPSIRVSLNFQYRFLLLATQISFTFYTNSYTCSTDLLYFQYRFPLLSMQISFTRSTDFPYFQYRFPLLPSTDFLSEHISIINRFKTIENIQMHRDPNRAQYTGSLNKIEKLQDVDSHYYYYLTETLNWETMYERTCKTAPRGARAPKP